MKMKKKKDAKQDLLIIDAETGLLSHPSTLECVSPNSGILFPNLFGASGQRITLYHQSRIVECATILYVGSRADLFQAIFEASSTNDTYTEQRSVHVHFLDT